MKKTRFTILATLLTLMVGTNAWGWGRDVHATITYIAERHLTPQAKANIEACIDGRSIVYYASWMDNHQEESKMWRHSSYYDKDTHKPVGTAYTELSTTIEKLGDYKSLSETECRHRLYHLLHALGDFHCPGHTYVQSADRSFKRNTHYNVVWIDNKETSYHTVWDILLVRYLRSAFGYMDFGHSLDCNIPQQYVEQVTAGTLYDWMCETANRCVHIYDKFPKRKKGTPKEELGHFDLDLVQEYSRLADEQILKAGLRMAKVLNESFGK
jgi:hypothetical protein